MTPFVKSYLLLLVLLNPFIMTVYLIELAKRLRLGLGPPVESLSPASGEVSGTIAMPFIVGPGTISASVIAGSRVGAPEASLAIGLALATAIGAIVLLKWLHDYIRTRSGRFVERYTEIAGRVTALFTGTFAIEMILNGLETWLGALGGGA